MTPRKTLRSLRVLDVTIDAIQRLAPVVRTIRTSDSDLAAQIRRAASSIALNLGEGNASLGGNRRKHFHIALGSTREVREALRVAVAWGYIAEVGSIDEQLDIIGAMTWRLMHSGP
ncbi:MAG: four helix bundle protein [Sandaracinaceae bacterium]|nr:four helix bundle protein [Sandaracinaceae bacterium]